MTRRVARSQSRNNDVRALLELTVRRLGYEAVREATNAATSTRCSSSRRARIGRSALRRFGADAPPVVCLSIYPREDGLEPAASVAYLVKPASSTEIGDALRSVFGV